MRYNVVDLLKAPTGEKREVELDDMLDLADDGVHLAGPVQGRLQLLRSLDGVLAEGRLHVPVLTECVRCLEPLVLDVEFDLEEVYRPTVEVPGGPGVAGTHDDEDAATLIDELHVLDLGEVLRQDVLLAVPVHPLCRSDCRGLCPRCGAELTEESCPCKPEPDPRWAALRSLLDDTE